jgi:hypothetical protein
MTEWFNDLVASNVAAGNVAGQDSTENLNESPSAVDASVGLPEMKKEDQPVTSQKTSGPGSNKSTSVNDSWSMTEMDQKLGRMETNSGKTLANIDVMGRQLNDVGDLSKGMMKAISEVKETCLSLAETAKEL